VILCFIFLDLFFSSGLLHFQNHECEVVGLGVTVYEGDDGFEDVVV